MSIKTTTFGGLRLTGKDSEAFVKQFLTGKPKANPLAQESLRQGRKTVQAMEKNGYAIIKPLKKG